MVDLNDYDVRENILNADLQEQFRKDDFVNAINEEIKDQYQNFENLGNNIIKENQNNLDDQDKIKIFREMTDYVDNNIINIVDIESTDDEVSRQILEGNYIYEFICIDNISSLIPALMEILNISSLNDFDLLVNTKYLNNPASFKNDFMQTVDTTIQQLIKLQLISPTVKTDVQYNKLLAKYYYYKELVEYCDPDKFINNYIRPVISKYSSDLIWRLF